MKQLVLVVIFVLILITSLVKNSTKEIEDQIFAINENIRPLKSELEDVLLEFNYLSSPEKLVTTRDGTRFHSIGQARREHTR